MTPFLNQELTEKALKTLSRLEEAIPGTRVPDAFKSFAGSEAPANDLYLNLKRQLDSGKVEKTDKLLLATALASANGSPEGVEFFGSAAAEVGVSKQNLSDGIGIAGICTIFNQYYHFKDLGGEEFKAFNASFNANSFAGSSLSAAQVEMICVTVSSLNNCHMCVEAHLKKARSAGLTDEQLDECVKVLSVVTAFSRIIQSLNHS